MSTTDNTDGTDTNFIAYQVSAQMLRELVPIIPAIRRQDPDLARQLRRAGSSVHLNPGESRGRQDGDRRRLFEYAHGSVYEVDAALAVARTFGSIADDLPVNQTVRRLIGLIWGLRNSKR